MKIRSIVDIICSCLANYSPGREGIYQYVESVLLNYSVYVPQTDDDAGNGRMDCSAVGVSTTIQTKSLKDQLTIQQRQFISDVCCGVVDNRPVLKGCTDLLYAQNPQLLPSAKNLYHLLFYYTIFELLNQPFSKLRAILVSQQASVILPFLRLVWGEALPSQTDEYPDKGGNSNNSRKSNVSSNTGSCSDDNEQSLMYQTIKSKIQEARLSANLQSILESHFDENYVRGPLTQAIVGNCYQDACELISALSHKSEAKDAKQKRETPRPPVPTSTTQFAAPVTSVNTAKKATDIDTSELQCKMDYKAKKAPTKMLSKTMDEVLTEAKAERKNYTQAPSTVDKRAAKWYEEDQQRHSQSKQKLVEKQREEEAAQAAQAASEKKQLVTRKKYAQAQPPRETKATILHANAVVQNALNAEAEELNMYMTGLRDSSEFDMWRAAMLELDRQKRLEEIETHKRDAKLAFEEAKYAREIAAKLKAAKASKDSEEHLRQLLEYFEKDEQRLIKAQQSVKEKHDELQIKLKEAKKDLAREKQKLADERRQDHIKNMEYISDVKLTENVERVELVKQIKAMLEVIGADREKKLIEKYDASTTAGHGLLNEMSLTELRERLLLMKEVNLQLLEDRHASILAAKEAEQAELQKKKDQIARVKEAIRKDRKQLQSGGALGGSFSIYQKYIDAVQESISDIVASYDKELKKRMKSREEQTRELLQQGEVARAAANALRAKLRERSREKTATKIFMENTLNGTYTKEADMYYTKAAFPGQERAQIYEKTKQRQQENRKNYLTKMCSVKSELNIQRQMEFEQQQKLAAEEAARAAQRKQDLHKAQKEWELQRDRNDALRDPYRASVKGAGHTGREAGMYEGIFV